MVKILAGELKLVFRPFLEKFRMAVPGIEALLYRSAFYNENIPRSAIWKSRVLAMRITSSFERLSLFAASIMGCSVIHRPEPDKYSSGRQWSELLRGKDTTFINENHWFRGNDTFCGVENKKQPQKPAFLPKDDWKAVLRYSPYVPFHEAGWKYQWAGSFWMSECHKPYLLWTSDEVLKVCRRFY